MVAARPTPRLRVTTRSVVVAVALLGLTLALLRLFAAAERVVGWILMAAAVAGLLHPLVSWLGRRVPRGLAVAAVGVASLAASAGVVYGAVDDLVEEGRNLQSAAPRRAAQLEEGRFAALAQEFELVERTERFVEEAPERLRGGTAAEAIRAATTRGVAFLTVAVLTLFFLLHGPRLAEAAVAQVSDEGERARWRLVAFLAFRRGFGYARGTLLLAAVAGLVAFALATRASVPGPAPLALWVALWDVVPLFGAVVGALPIVGLAAADSPSKALVVAAAFVAYQVLETAVLQRRLERRTLRVGPFLTVVGGFAGLELYGIAGALLAVLALALGLAVVEDLRPA